MYFFFAKPSFFFFFFLCIMEERQCVSFSSGNAFLHFIEATSRVFLYNKSIYHTTQAARMFVHSTLSCLVSLGCLSQPLDTFTKCV